MISERNLRQFIAVAEELNFGRAAERLHVAQPALSYAVKKIERYVGVQLIDRSRSSVSLTHAGRRFLEDSYQTLQHINFSIERARQVTRGKTGRLAIGFLGTAGYGLVPSLMADYRQACPDVETQLLELSTLEQLDRLETKQIDVGIVRSPFFGEKDFLHTRLIARDQMMVALPAHHRLARRKTLSMAELKDEGFVIFSRDHVPASYAALMTLCSLEGFHPLILQECIQVSGLICVVAAGVGIALVPSDLKALQHPKVSYVPLKGSHSFQQVEISLAWHKDNHNPAIPGFVKRITEHFGEPGNTAADKKA